MDWEIYDLHVEAPFEYAEPDQRHVLDVALEYDATAYDAVYISLRLISAQCKPLSSCRQ